MIELSDRMLDLAIQIQQIPAPTFNEQARAEFVRARFLAEGLQDVAVDEVSNVYGCLPGQRNGLPVVVSAHLDTVFPAGTPLDITREEGKICGPGIGDNSLGVAGLFGLIWALRQAGETAQAGDIWLVANSCEEGLGDLRGMQRVVQRFGGSVRAYIIVEGMALGQVYNRGLGVRRYRISVKTRGGHSWVDYGAPSAIHELARLITALNEIELPRYPRTTLNVGVISGGTSVNTIASHASLELDLRSEGPAELTELSAKVEQLIAGCCRSEAEFTAEVIGSRPAGELPDSHPLVKLAVESLEGLGIEAHINIGSTDANIPLSLGYPAVTIGLSNGFGAHTIHETLYTTPAARGLSHLAWLVSKAFEL